MAGAGMSRRERLAAMAKEREAGEAEKPSVVNTTTFDGVAYPRKVRDVRGKREWRYLCEKCGTWVCDRCGHKREGANRGYTGVHRCARCGCLSGKWQVIYHYLAKWTNHYGHVPTRDWVYEDWRKGLPGRRDQ